MMKKCMSSFKKGKNKIWCPSSFDSTNCDKLCCVDLWANASIAGTRPWKFRRPKSLISIRVKATPRLLLVRLRINPKKILTKTTVEICLREVIMMICWIRLLKIRERMTAVGRKWPLKRTWIMQIYLGGNQKSKRILMRGVGSLRIRWLLWNPRNWLNQWNSHTSIPECKLNHCLDNR